MKNNLNIVFEDKNILAVDKKAGISVIAKEYEQEQNTLLNELKNNNGKNIIPVTSLDKGASGIVLFAKSRDSYNFLSEQFKAEKVKKTYNIIVNGIMEQTQGKIDKKLLVDKENTVVSEKGVNSITEYNVLEQFKIFAFIKTCPLTTRRNQIRAHFWSLGNPLAIDEIYASSEPIMLSALKKRYKGIKQEKPLLNRLAMHLSKIELLLPEKKEQIIFEAELPKDINITLKQLRKYNKRG